MTVTAGSTAAAGQVILARQAIFDRDLAVVGYELLYRDRDRNQALVVNGNTATAATLVKSFVDFGLERLVGQSLAFFNLTRDAVLSVADLQLPIDSVVLEVLEEVAADERVVAALRHLAAAGYIVALDDFVYSPELIPLLEFAAIVKIDVLATPRDEIAKVTELLRPYPARLLAEKVETHEELEFCRSLGFDYFQGYFLCRPDLQTTRQAPAGRGAGMALLARMVDPTLGLEEFAELITADAGMSFKFLRYINSAFFAWPLQVGSVHEALVLLGERGVRSWLILVALAGATNKPSELITIALVRAQTCRALGKATLDADACFTVGLFSVLDALTDLPMAEALAGIPLTDELVDALTRGKGPLADVLDVVLAQERGEGADCPQQVADAYLASIAWADGLLAAASA